MTTIAERHLTAVDADGARFDMTIRLSAPRQRGTDWGCELSITHLFEPPRPIFGVDSWQALTLAHRLAEQLLAHFEERGGRLLHHEAG